MRPEQLVRHTNGTFVPCAASIKPRINTASDLKYYVEASEREPHFFDRKTMRFFGDTMKNYGVRQPREVETINGPVMAYELYRRAPVKHQAQGSAWFSAETFERVFPEKEPQE